MDQKNVKLTDIFREEKWSQRISKFYEAVRLKTVEHGDRYISGFGNEENKAWNIGDEVTLIITESQKADRSGRPYLNFETVKKPKQAAGTAMPVEVVRLLTAMKLEVDEIYKFILGKQATKNAEDALDAAISGSDDGPSPDDIPF